jgi:hypothetical protein
MKNFDRKTMFLQPGDPAQDYKRHAGEEKKAIAWGQRKLLLSEIWFLNLCWDPNVIENPIIVYVGAADGKHISFLSELYPQVEFHLYDPRDFHILESEKIKLHNEFFSDNDALEWSARQIADKNIFFISDIRTANYEKMSYQEVEAAVLRDNENQRQWFETINPVSGLLKCRPPYDLGFQNRYYRYLGGYLLKQPFSSQTSTETRLVPVRENDNDENKWKYSDYDIVQYQNQMYYHNRVIRQSIEYINPFTGTGNMAGTELSNDYDSLGEITILQEYLIKMSGVSTYKDVIGLSNGITEKLTTAKSSALLPTPQNKINLAVLRKGVLVEGVIARDFALVLEKGFKPAGSQRKFIPQSGESSSIPRGVTPVTPKSSSASIPKTPFTSKPSPKRQGLAGGKIKL